MKPMKNRPLPPDTPAPSITVRLLCAMYGSADRVPFWALHAWNAGWRPVLRKKSQQSIIQAAKAAHQGADHLSPDHKDKGETEWQP